MNWKIISKKRKRVDIQMTVQTTTNSIPTSGSISFSLLRSIFKETTSGPISLKELYKNGSYVPSGNTTGAVPTNGAISVSNFRGVAASIIANITNVEQNLNAFNLFSSEYGTAIRKTINVNGHIISQSSNPALTIPSGAGSTIKIKLTSGGIFGHRGVSAVNNIGPISSLSAYDNGIEIPYYYDIVGYHEECYSDGDNYNCYQVPDYGYINYSPSDSGSALLTSNSSNNAAVTWYYWSQNGRISWELSNAGTSYISGNTVKFISGNYGSFEFVCYVTIGGGTQGSGNGGPGVPGNNGYTALRTYSNVQIIGTGGAIRGGGGGAGGGGAGGYGGGGGKDSTDYGCGIFGWWWSVCQKCEQGVSGQGATGSGGGTGGQGRGYSWDGVNLILNGPDAGTQGTSSTKKGGDGGDWGSPGGRGTDGDTGGKGPGGTCQAGGDGSGGGSGGSGGNAGNSIEGYNRVVSIESTAILSGPITNN